MITKEKRVSFSEHKIKIVKKGMGVFGDV